MVGFSVEEANAVQQEVSSALSYFEGLFTDPFWGSTIEHTGRHIGTLAPTGVIIVTPLLNCALESQLHEESWVSTVIPLVECASG